MAGLSKRTFAELLSDYGVSLINYSVEDLKDELARNARI
jgi:predicted HTH domain antitoxin